MSLEDRLTSLADATTRASSGIDASVALASFRRRWRARLAAGALAAAAAVAGLAVGAAQLLPRAGVGPAATPGPSSASGQQRGVACGLPLDEALLTVTGIDRTAPLPADAPTDRLEVALTEPSMTGDGVVDLAAHARFEPGPFVDKAGPWDVTYTLRAFVVDARGHVIGHAAPWQVRDDAPLESTVRFVTCPGEGALGSRAGEELELRIAAERSGPTVDTTLTVSPAIAVTVASEPEAEPTQIDGPGSCGQVFFPDGVSESEGMIRYGLGAELMDLTVTADGRVRGHLVLRNNGEQRLTGSYVLTHVLVEAHEGPYHGSILTLAEPLELTDVVSVGAGDAMRVELDLETDACADDVLPLAPGDYTVSVQVDLATAEVGFASPALKVRVD